MHCPPLGTLGLATAIENQHQLSGNWCETTEVDSIV